MTPNQLLQLTLGRSLVLLPQELRSHAQLNIGVMLLRSFAVVLVSLLTFPSGAVADYTRGCEWNDTKLDRVECFLETGIDLLKSGDTVKASNQFLSGIRWLGLEYLEPYGSDASASSLMYKAAIADAAGDRDVGASLRRDMLKAGISNLKEEQ